MRTLILLFVLALAWWPARSLAAQGALPAACVAASHEVKWPQGFDPGAALRGEIERYRQGWRQACAEPGQHSLAVLLATADGLSRQLGAHPGIVHIDPSGQLVERLDAVNAFLPAMAWNCCEGTGFLVVEQAFVDAAVGNAEDRAFLVDYVAARGQGWLPPWIESTWDYGGCTRYGDYDWKAGLLQIGRLRSVARSPAYRRRVEDLEHRLLQDGFVPSESADAVCACTDQGRDAFPDELRRLSMELATAPGFGKYKQHVDRVLRRFETGRIVVGSEVRKRCSGG